MSTTATQRNIASSWAAYLAEVRKRDGVTVQCDGCGKTRRESVGWVCGWCDVCGAVMENATDQWRCESTYPAPDCSGGAR